MHSKKKTLKNLFCALVLVLFTCACRNKKENATLKFEGKPEVPSSIKMEHEYLLGRIHKFTLFHDSTGLAAVKLKDLMKHHFEEEEDYVLPPLGILPELANGKLPGQSKEIIRLCEKLKLQSVHLSAEHQLIKAFTDELRIVAVKENHPEIIEFERELHKHAHTEEEVLYPAAILIGEYLKLKSL